MAKKMKPVKLPPPDPEKTVVLTMQEQQALVGLITQVQEWNVKSDQPKETLEFWEALSDKIMNEEEAARYLQSLGFDIVKKE